MASTVASSDFDYLFKVLFIGDSGVGKSSVLIRMTEGGFYEDQSCTIGVDFKQYLVKLNDKRVNLTIWDTAGQEKFRSLTSSYYRGTQGIILVYDVTSNETFENIENWLEEVNTYSTNNDVVKLLVGNKCDMKEERVVSFEKGKKYADEKALLFAECSSKTGEGIENAIEVLVSRIMSTPSCWSNYSVNSNRPKSVLATPEVSVPSSDDTQKTGCYCLI
eukprot:TRINITY_DN1624_c0_g1_i2.p1 TRINITY_DN1624_c0_g1~~TRINITY_DN1624_c0_g1_i2.p1  ORF type:complete len:219 (-),score=35.77 TRINITY_DN1624_c0_g1_i2:63-719(-)